MKGQPRKFHRNLILRTSIGISMAFLVLVFVQAVLCIPDLAGAGTSIDVKRSLALVFPMGVSCSPTCRARLTAAGFFPVWRKYPYSIKIYPYEQKPVTSAWAAHRQIKARENSVLNKSSEVGSESSSGNVFESRRSHVRNKCNDLDLPKLTSDTRKRFLILKDRNVSYCYVPKAGCTYWKRVFIAMQKKRYFSNVSKVKAHAIDIDSLFGLKTFDATYNFLVRSKRMLFVRDPYTRLFSAYQDKLFLNDFWSAFGKNIIKKFRPNPSKLALQCGHNVTFEEFLLYVLDVAKDGFLGSGEEHWLPISTLCHPCTFDYHFIGKQETFASDRDYILNELKIDIPANRSGSIAKEAMQETIDMSWGRGQDCVNTTDMLERMWTMYQSQGHIHASVAFPRNTISKNITKDGFLNFALAVHKSKTLTSDERRKQREEAVIKAYNSVSSKILKRIQKVFYLDFELFQYPIKPAYIFDSWLKTNLK